MKRVIIAAALCVASPAFAQDDVSSSAAPAPTQVRLPLLRAAPDGDRVVIQMLGSAAVPVGTADGYYVGPNGFTPNVAEAQDFRGAMGAVSTVNGTVAGPAGQMGSPGASAYQLWLAAGNVGDRAAFLASLVGSQGAPGVAGGVGPVGPASTIPGPSGSSAYQVAVSNGYSGTQAQWLASLVGVAGRDGLDGKNGVDGQSITGAKGDTGSRGSDGASITGPAGKDGSNGVSPVLTIGAVTSLASGATATATITGTTAAPVLSLGIPVGAQGLAGIGVKGDTGATPSLSVGTVTTLAAGSAATATIAGTAANPVLSLGIPSGATGAASTVAGPTGSAGTAATVAVGTVTALGAGSAPTVTNAGTTSAAVLNFGIPSSVTFLADATVSQSAAVAVNAGYRSLTATLTGCQVNDRVLVTPTNLPAGYSIADAYCATANTLTANVYAPALVIGASYSITLKVTVFR